MWIFYWYPISENNCKLGYFLPRHLTSKGWVSLDKFDIPGFSTEKKTRSAKAREMLSLKFLACSHNAVKRSYCSILNSVLLAGFIAVVDGLYTKLHMQDGNM
jgi:hypothetical protein